MENSLSIVDATTLTPEERNQLDIEIDKMINAHRNNRQEINRLVFECTAALTEAENDSRRLTSKGFFSRLVGGITGSNRELQNKINNDLQTAQYASQVTLQKLTEQNLMTFDLITAVNNKLNASVKYVDEQFKNQFMILGKFFLKNRSDIVNLELRVSHLEQNMGLLRWQDSIEYLQFDGVEYNALDDTAKVVCLVRDFYDLTKGNWTTSDLLLLKTAMGRINLSPHKELNYFDTIKNIADSTALSKKLLGGQKISQINDPSYLITMGTLGKMNSLENEEHYYTLSVQKLLSEAGIDKSEKVVRDTIVQNYMKEKASVDLDSTIEAYNLALDFLYNLNQAEKEQILLLPESGSDSAAISDLASAFLQNPQMAFSEVKSSADKGSGLALYLMGWYFDGGYNAVKIDEKKAVEYFRQSFNAGYVPAGVKLSADEKDEDKKEELVNQARNEILRLAQVGDCFAQCRLGWMYANGRGVEQSYEEAAKWYQKAVEQGEPIAQNNLGLMYQYGNGVEQSYEKALKWYRKAAEQGYALAQRQLGVMYENGHGVEQSYEEAVNWYRKAAKQGEPFAQCDLGVMYENGRGVEQSSEEAIKWFRKAAEQGNAIAQNNLGVMYENGRGVEQSYENAAKWYRKAAEQGEPIAQKNLGVMYANGQGVEQSYEEAIKWIRKAAEQGEPHAQNNLGRMYANGDGVEQSYEEAIKWIRKAAEQGDANAQNNLGRMYQYGQGVERSDEEAAKWYRKAAEQGLAGAQLKLGELYSSGYGVEKSYEEAAKWYLKAAEQGLARAQFHLGDFYLHGYGVERSDEEAIKWYRKAAEQGDTFAQFFLGDFYRDGEGVEKSDEEAAKWYRKAAEQGYNLAQVFLGEMYLNGQGVEQSYEEAIKWFRKAAEQENGEAQYHLGYMYDHGYGVEQSYEDAAKWYGEAVKNGNDDAIYRIGLLYENGHGVVQSYEWALKWFYKAAEQGVAKAKTHLGDMYDSGRGVKKSVSEAAKWYYEAAVDGDADAQFKLGGMYIEGHGVKQSNEEGLKWYRESAEQGYDIAQQLLGWLYENGIFVEQSSEEAEKWYKKSGHKNLSASGKVDRLEQRFLSEEKGIPGESLFNNGNYAEALPLLQQAYSQGGTVSGKAALYIGIMCAQGLGVQVNLTNAKAWLDIAVQMGDEDTKRIAKDWIGRLFGQ